MIAVGRVLGRLLGSVPSIPVFFCLLYNETIQEILKSLPFHIYKRWGENCQTAATGRCRVYGIFHGAMPVPCVKKAIDILYSFQAWKKCRCHAKRKRSRISNFLSLLQLRTWYAISTKNAGASVDGKASLGHPRAL